MGYIHIHAHAYIHAYVKWAHMRSCVNTNADTCMTTKSLTKCSVNIKYFTNKYALVSANIFVISSACQRWDCRRRSISCDPVNVSMLSKYLWAFGWLMQWKMWRTIRTLWPFPTFDQVQAIYHALMKDENQNERYTSFREETVLLHNGFMCVNENVLQSTNNTSDLDF